MMSSNCQLMLLFMMMYSFQVASQSLFSDFNDSNKLIYVDGTGRTILNTDFDFGEEFSEGVALVEKDFKYGFIDKSGEIVIPLIYDDAESFRDGFTIVQIQGKYFLIDTSGTRISDKDYDNLRRKSSTLMSARIGSQWGFIDKNSNTKIPFRFQDVGDFSDGLCSVLLDGEWKYINERGSIEIDGRYSSAGEFSEGLAPVKVGNHSVGYIDTHGKFVIPYIFTMGTAFEEGKAMVGRRVGPEETIYFMINTKGDCVKNCDLSDKIYRWYYGRLVLADGTDYGCKTWVSPFRYTTAYPAFGLYDENYVCPNFWLHPGNNGWRMTMSNGEVIVLTGRIKESSYENAYLWTYDENEQLEKTHHVDLINGQAIAINPISNQGSISRLELSAMLGVAGLLLNEDLSIIDASICVLMYNIDNLVDNEANARIVAGILNSFQTNGKRFSSSSALIQAVKTELVKNTNTSIQEFYGLLEIISCLSRK